MYIICDSSDPVYKRYVVYVEYVSSIRFVFTNYTTRISRYNNTHGEQQELFEHTRSNVLFDIMRFRFYLNWFRV